MFIYNPPCSEKDLRWLTKIKINDKYVRTMRERENRAHKEYGLNKKSKRATKIKFYRNPKKKKRQFSKLSQKFLSEAVS